MWLPYFHTVTMPFIYWANKLPTISLSWCCFKIDSQWKFKMYHIFNGTKLWYQVIAAVPRNRSNRIRKENLFARHTNHFCIQRFKQIINMISRLSAQVSYNPLIRMYVTACTTKWNRISWCGMWYSSGWFYRCFFFFLFICRLLVVFVYSRNIILASEQEQIKNAVNDCVQFVRWKTNKLMCNRVRSLDACFWEP